MGSNRPILAAILAALQGIIWFVTLIHGGWGLFFGPLALVAAVAALWFPWAVMVLLLPAGFLALSWLPHLGGLASASQWVIPLLLVVPALLSAAAVIARRVLVHSNA